MTDSDYTQCRAETTLRAYAENAAGFVRRWESLSPASIERTLEKWVPAGARLLEVGCGSGRDARALALRGVDVLATDGSPEILAEARRIAAALPGKALAHLRFAGLRLPAGFTGAEEMLGRLGLDAPADAVLACGVLEHLPADELYAAVREICFAAGERGTVIVSVPVDHPGEDGRWYSNYPPEHYIDLFDRFGFAAATREENRGGPAGSESTWVTIVFVRSAGRERARANIQGVIENDSKTSTYKFALLRALADVNCASPGRVRYLPASEMAAFRSRASEKLSAGSAGSAEIPHQIAIPFSLVIERTIAYYWQIFRDTVLTNAPLPPQIGGGRRLAFETELTTLMRLYVADWVSARSDFYAGVLAGARRAAFIALARKVHETLIKGPIHYSGNSLGDTAPGLSAHRLFSVARAGVRWPAADGSEPFTPAILEAVSGELMMPSELWRELNSCAPWLADAVILRWAARSADFPAKTLSKEEPLSKGQIISRMLPAEEARDTAAARGIYESELLHNGLRCVWSDKPLTLETLAVDHMIPWARTHSNDLWNLVPADSRQNGSKSDAIPSLLCLDRSKDRIIRSWRLYEESSLRPLFRAQAASALTGRALPSCSWEVPLMDAVLRAADETARQFSCRRWDPVI